MIKNIRWKVIESHGQNHRIHIVLTSNRAEVNELDTLDPRLELIKFYQYVFRTKIAVDHSNITHLAQENANFLDEVLASVSLTNTSIVEVSI